MDCPPPNGWIKSVLGFRQFSMRGLNKANAELKLVSGAESEHDVGDADGLRENRGPQNRWIDPCHPTQTISNGNLGGYKG
jgi:hypothetical protein